MNIKDIFKNKETINEYLRFKDINDPLDHGETLLHWACYCADLEIIMYLIDIGANINARNTLGCTPLYSSSYYGRLDVVKFLIQYGADRKILNKSGASILDAANIAKKSDIVDYLNRFEDIPKSPDNDLLNSFLTYSHD